MNTPGQPLSRHRPCQLLSVEGIFWVVQKLVVGRLQLSPFLCYRSELFVHADAGFIGRFDDISNYHVVKNKPIVNSRFFSFCDLIFFLLFLLALLGPTTNSTWRWSSGISFGSYQRTCSTNRKGGNICNFMLMNCEQLCEAEYYSFLQFQMAIFFASYNYIQSYLQTLFIYFH